VKESTVGDYIVIDSISAQGNWPIFAQSMLSGPTKNRKAFDIKEKLSLETREHLQAH